MAGRRCKYYRTVVTVEVITEGEPALSEGVTGLVRKLVEGEYTGRWDYSIRNQPLKVTEAREALARLGDVVDRDYYLDKEVPVRSFDDEEGSGPVWYVP